MSEKVLPKHKTDKEIRGKLETALRRSQLKLAAYLQAEAIEEARTLAWVLGEEHLPFVKLAKKYGVKAK